MRGCRRPGLVALLPCHRRRARSVGMNGSLQLVGLLGPVEVVSSRGQAASRDGAADAASLVAMLAVMAGRVIPEEALIDLFVGKERSESGSRTLQTHLHALQRLAKAKPDGQPFRIKVG
jgi:hypothetical protein